MPRSPDAPTRARCAARVALLACGLAFAAGGPGTSAARGEAVPPGQRAVPREVRLDLGDLAPVAVRLHPVARGDTLSHIAERELGTVRRQAEILALNPGLEPARIRAGQVLVLPAPAPDVAEPWHFFLLAPGGRPVRVGHGATVAPAGEGAFLVALRGARVGELLRWSERPPSGRERALDTLLARPGAARADPLPGGLALVPADGPVEREVLTLRVRGIAAGRIEVEETSRGHFDGANRRVEEATPLGVWLGAFAGALLLGVGVLAWRRRRAATARPATP